MTQLYLKKIKVIVHDDENIILHSAFPAYLTSPTSSLSHLLLFFIIIIVMKEKKTPHTHTQQLPHNNIFLKSSSETVKPHIAATNYTASPSSTDRGPKRPCCLDQSEPSSTLCCYNSIFYNNNNNRHILDQ